MIFDDFESLNEAISGLRSESRLLDNDAEVEHLYQSSPPFFNQIATYELESLFRTELCKPNFAVPEEVAKDVAPDAAKVEEQKQDYPRAEPKPFLLPCRQEDMFKPQEYSMRDAARHSHLATQLAGPQVSQGSIKLTIYLPDIGTSMIVFANEKDTYEELICKILALHKQKGIKPPLRYEDVSFYDIFQNDGDGEPDRDFSFRKSQKVSENNLDEYCLCEIDQDGGDDDYPRTAASNSVGNRSRFDSFGSGSAVPTLPQNTVRVSISISSRSECYEVKYKYEEKTTMKQLLVDLRNGKYGPDGKAPPLKIQLYTEEFSFSVSADDQTRLKLMSQVVDMNALVSFFGDGCKFQLRKRVFDDSARRDVGRPVASTKNARPGEDTNAVVYDESSAIVLQQWNVVKKNKMGTKQERVMGIDGKFIYNSVRGQPSGKGVKVPLREISSVASVEILDDKLTLRINWKEDKGGGYSIDYSCENERACAEIKSKLSFNLQKWSRRR